MTSFLWKSRWMSATMVACILLFGVASIVSAKRAPSQCRGLHGFGYGTCVSDDAARMATPTVSVDGKQVTIEWEPYTFAQQWTAHYKIEIRTTAGKKNAKNNKGKFPDVVKTYNEVTDTSTTVDTTDILKTNRTYKVRILAVRGDGETSRWSKDSATFKVKSEKNKGDGKDKDKGKNR